ncbi:cilia- and flagella-associated protein HOATZ-like [Ptychodera flava]|uniref:cilia- and flagella-associated protein HOATZ-like n=1 Tax=Ptychodera flava TaxID=63121 RepID=UPI00396A39BF
MAASTTQVMPEDLTEFSNSRKEDQACAKLFWQSITLLPPIESRLVSGDIRQRLPVAKPKGTFVNRAFKPIEEPKVLTKFLETAHSGVLQEESGKLMRQAQKREETIMRLRRRKEERIQKEEISHKLRKPIELDDDDYDEGELEEAAVAMQQLDQFEKTINGTSGDVDSD